MDRRDFLRTAGVIAAGERVRPDREVRLKPDTAYEVREVRADGAVAQRDPSAGDREYWISVMRRLADPVLTNLANGTLKAQMPVEQGASDRRSVTHLEAIGRLIAGLAPWIELAADETSEGKLRAQYAALAHRAIARAVDPASPDFMNFTRDRQPLVDAAFLAQGILRAPRTLGDGFGATTKRQLIAALESTRAITPGFNNWLLFSATVEACLKSLGADWDRTRVDYALREHEQWYKGDGAYGDGPDFHWDYYNSFVIHPMLADVLDACKDESPAWEDLAAREAPRARRYAAVQERLIGPDGSFPPIGRSIAYRCGAFHLLAQAALRRALPEGVAPAQVRSALTAVTFDPNGWLRIGFCGHQPGIGETYISTGSLYLCSAALLPLGLPASDEFWSAPPQPWTSASAWSGQPFPIDHAI
jgi:hypothetical protein